MRWVSSDPDKIGRVGHDEGLATPYSLSDEPVPRIDDDRRVGSKVMSENETIEVAAPGKALLDQSSELVSRSTSRRGLLTSLLALSVGAAAVIDPEPAVAESIGIGFGGFRFSIPVYTPGGGKRYPSAGPRSGRRPSKRRPAKRSKGKGTEVARPGGGGGSSGGGADLPNPEFR
jgi:hypothetical protein